MDFHWTFCCSVRGSCTGCSQLSITSHSIFPSRFKELAFLHNIVSLILMLNTGIENLKWMQDNWIKLDLNGLDTHNWLIRWLTSRLAIFCRKSNVFNLLLDQIYKTFPSQETNTIWILLWHLDQPHSQKVFMRFVAKKFLQHKNSKKIKLTVGLIHLSLSTYKVPQLKQKDIPFSQPVEVIGKEGSSTCNLTKRRRLYHLASPDSKRQWWFPVHMTAAYMTDRIGRCLHCMLDQELWSSLLASDPALPHPFILFLTKPL
jgi:hypothetical protein